MTSSNIGFHWLKTASSLAASTEVYSYLPSNLRLGSCPLSRRVTWYWKSPRTRPMRGVNTHVSAPKSNTDWRRDLKKNPDSGGLPPPCSVSSTLSDKLPAPLSGFGSSPASHHLLPIVIYPGI